MSHYVDFQIIYTPDEGGYNALEPITQTTSWGETLAEAKEMITEALELYFAETAEDEAAKQIAGAAGAVSGSVHIEVGA